MGQVSGYNLLEFVTTETFSHLCSVNRHSKDSVSFALSSTKHLSPFTSQIYIPWICNKR